MDGCVKIHTISLSLVCSTQVIDQHNQSQKYWNLYEQHASNIVHFKNGYFLKN